MINEEIRREAVHKNKSSALVVLNTLSWKEGEFLSIKYQTPTGKIDSMVGVGLKDGVGSDCYTLISDRSIPCITAILNYIPDISEMITGSIFIFNDPGSNEYWKCYHREGELVKEEITESFYFTCLDDDQYYYFDSTRGAQRIINISSNLSEKASFQGIINISQEGYDELVEGKMIKDDFLYLVNNGERVTGLYYNYMTFEFDLDPNGSLEKRIDELEEMIKNAGMVWMD